MRRRQLEIRRIALFAAVLGTAVAGSLQAQVPSSTGLQRALERYRDIAARGGWPTVPSGKRLDPGVREVRVATLRRRLEAEGYPIGTGPGDSERYDGALESAVRRFQELHGLPEDGLVGPATLAALNVPATTRAEQISLNLERQRTFADSLGDRYLLVNSATFTLDVIEGGRSVLHLRTIVGRPDWPTPVVSSRITE
ncbi:MAG TPA: peptidoglycan-binding protein, partial [Gemmatimonadales bacterium]|nr:peptidoglycan-binding protein [Gemmatimonadales bacterium]